MNNNFFNIMNKVIPQSPGHQHTPPDVIRPKKSLLGLPSRSSYPKLSSSISFDSIKSHTSRVSTGVLSTLNNGRQKVTKYINQLGSEQENITDARFPSIFEQLKWPNLSLDNKLKRSKGSVGEEADDEENIVDRFVRVIQSEDFEENPQSTFFNHPTRV